MSALLAPYGCLIDGDNDREIILLINHLDSGASAIAAIYKDSSEIV